MIETYASDDLYKTINGSLQETDPQMNVILVAILLTQCQKKKKKNPRGSWHCFSKYFHV